MQMGLHIVFYFILLAVLHEQDYFGYRRRLGRCLSCVCPCCSSSPPPDRNAFAMRALNQPDAGAGHPEAPADPDVIKECSLVDQEASRLGDSVLRFLWFCFSLDKLKTIIDIYMTTTCITCRTARTQR